MTIAIKPTASGSTIEQNGSTILTVDGSGNLTVPNNMTFSGTVTGISSYSDSDALSLFNASGSAPVYACRAWVNFDGDGTVSIRDSGNVSSITDNGTGDYAVNLTTAMQDTNYSIAGASGLSSGSTQTFFQMEQQTFTSTSVIDIATRSESGSRRDSETVSMQVFR
jgi:hypothetical protein